MFSPLGIDAMLQAEKKIFAAIQYLHNHCDLIKHQIGLDLRDVIAWQKNRLAAEAILSVHLKNDNPTRSDQHLVVMCKRVEAVEFYRCHFDKFCVCLCSYYLTLRPKLTIEYSPQSPMASMASSRRYRIIRARLNKS